MSDPSALVCPNIAAAARREFTESERWLVSKIVMALPDNDSAGWSFEPAPPMRCDDDICPTCYGIPRHSRVMVTYEQPHPTKPDEVVASMQPMDLSCLRYPEILSMQLRMIKDNTVEVALWTAKDGVRHAWSVTEHRTACGALFGTHGRIYLHANSRRLDRYAPCGACLSAVRNDDA